LCAESSHRLRPWYAALRFGATLPQIKRSWEESRAAAVEFDALGYDSLFVCDHLLGVPLPTLPILEAWSLLAAVAAVTKRARLGTLVTPPFFRNPAVLAKQIATIDAISGGRAIAGLGAGWFEGVPRLRLPFPPLAERHARAGERSRSCAVVDAGPRASRGDTSRQGRGLRAGSQQRPAILIGGSGERVLMGIAARHADIWNNMAVFQPRLAEKIEALRRRCDEVGRDFSTLEISQQCVIEETMTPPGPR
jgi:alkanesulfonate monooxygenase SsuD/methylene tetrahydromethanopterin reductase-like flavin-dependent oxidoreductase (luciferase family)